MTTFTDSPAEIDKQVERILRESNITEPGGDWSIHDLARQLDPDTRKPTRLFDTGPDTQPSGDYVIAATQSLRRLSLSRPGLVSGRYVGGTSGHLYSIVPR